MRFDRYCPQRRVQNLLSWPSFLLCSFLPPPYDWSVKKYKDQQEWGKEIKWQDKFGVRANINLLSTLPRQISPLPSLIFSSPTTFKILFKFPFWIRHHPFNNLLSQYMVFFPSSKELELQCRGWLFHLWIYHSNAYFPEYP